MKVTQRGVITKPADDENFNSNTFPCIEKLPSGRWLASFRASEKKGDGSFQQAVITWSDDEGITWSIPTEPVTLPDIDGIKGEGRTAYLLSLGGKRVLMLLNWVDAANRVEPYYDPQTECLKDTRIFSCISEDEGVTWTVPQLVDTGFADDPVPLTGTPFRLENGTIVCHFEINKRIGDPLPWTHKSAMIFSQDEGITWEHPVLVTNVRDMYYWDQRPNFMAGRKSILDFFWTMDGNKKEYLNIHARESLDGGNTWGAIWDTGIYGQPGQPVELGDGRIALITIDRRDSPVISINVTRDNGRTYEKALTVYEGNVNKQDSRHVSMNEAWAEMALFSVGHPSLLVLENGDLLAYFYAGSDRNYTEINYVRITV